MSAVYARAEPTAQQIESLSGPTVLEFGASWCGFCIRTQPLLVDALTHHPRARHIRIEDGSGRPLGRAYGVRLWPTFVFLRDGNEVCRLVRPHDAQAIRDALARIDPR